MFVKCVATRPLCARVVPSKQSMSRLVHLTQLYEQRPTSQLLSNLFALVAGTKVCLVCLYRVGMMGFRAVINAVWSWLRLAYLYIALFRMPLFLCNSSVVHRLVP